MVIITLEMHVVSCACGDYEEEDYQGCPSIQVLEHSKFWWALCDHQFEYCLQVTLPY